MAGEWQKITTLDDLPVDGRFLATDGRKVYITCRNLDCQHPEKHGFYIPANYGRGARITHWTIWAPLPQSNGD